MIYQGAVHPFCSLPVVAKAADGLVETQDQHTLNLEQYLAQSMEKVLTAQALRKGVLGEQVGEIVGEEPDAHQAQGAACPITCGRGSTWVQ